MSKIARQYKIIRVACYVRVSTEEQKKHGFSIATQVDTLTNFINKHDEYQLVGFYKDEGVSADKLKKRTELQRLLDDVKQGKIDLIIFTKLDRWFRSVEKYYRIQSILDEYNVTWLTTNEDYETVTANGKFKVNIMLSVAQQERDRTSERIKDVFEFKVKNGEPISGALPLGFKIITIDGQKKVVHDENEEMVKDILQFYMTNQNKRKTIEYVSEKYDFKYQDQSLTNLLRNTLLYGSYRGIENYCEPYITKKQFDDIQHMVKNNIRERKKVNVEYMFSKLIVCPHCGNTLIGHYATNRNKSGVTYIPRYRCENAYRTHRKCDLRVSKAEEIVEKQLVEKLDSYMKDYVIKCEVEQPETQKVDKSKIKAEMDRLNNMYLKGRIDEDTYDTKYTELNDKLSFEPQTVDLSHIKSLIGTNILSIYNTLNSAEKRSFWHSLIKAIHIDDTFTVTAIDFF